MPKNIFKKRQEPFIMKNKRSQRSCRNVTVQELGCNRFVFVEFMLSQQSIQIKIHRH